LLFGQRYHCLKQLNLFCVVFEVFHQGPLKLIDQSCIFKAFRGQRLQHFGLVFKQTSLTARRRFVVVHPDLAFLSFRPMESHRQALFTLHEEVDVFDQVVFPGRKSALCC
jgi:hypothetical protein